MPIDLGARREPELVEIGEFLAQDRETRAARGEDLADADRGPSAGTGKMARGQAAEKAEGFCPERVGVHGHDREQLLSRGQLHAVAELKGAGRMGGLGVGKDEDEGASRDRFAGGLLELGEGVFPGRAEAEEVCEGLLENAFRAGGASDEDHAAGEDGGKDEGVERRGAVGDEEGGAVGKASGPDDPETQEEAAVEAECEAEGGGHKEGRSAAPTTLLPKSRNAFK